ncbi:MAG TPA: hypothetical protein VGK73_07120, partial [Polyangiaceae bacterium]
GACSEVEEPGDGGSGAGATGGVTAGSSSGGGGSSAGNAGAGVAGKGAAGVGGAAGRGSAGAAGVGGATTGGTAGSGAAAGEAASGASGSGGIAAGGAGATAGSSAGGSGGVPPPGACAMTAERVRITEVELGTEVVNDEDEAALHPLAISPKPSGGSRIAWMGEGDQVHVAELDAADQLVGDPIALPAHDFSDLYADDEGGVVLLTRDAEGGGTLNCGEPTNLCGTPPDPPIACYDMYLVRFDGATESWATKLTNSSSSLPPYSTSSTGPDVFMIWWYAHHGRIASDGTNWAAYFGSAISVSQEGCINIHQGDRMKVVTPDGSPGPGGFDWGCSHSGYERIVWDPAENEFVTVCKTDNNNRISFAPRYQTIRPVDLAYSNLGDIVLANGGGYWLTTSDIREGEPAGMDGLADVRLLHFTTGAADADIVVAAPEGSNARAPHLAAYGSERLLAAWETSTQPGDLRSNDANRALHVQTRSRTTGEAEGDPLTVDVRGNRYQEFRAFPDGSVAYPAPGSSRTSIRVLRVLPCSG